MPYPNNGLDFECQNQGHEILSLFYFGRPEYQTYITQNRSVFLGIFWVKNIRCGGATIYFGT